MTRPAFAACSQHTRAVDPLDCMRCGVRELAVCAALPPSGSHANGDRRPSSIDLPANAVLARAGQPCRHAYSVTSGMLRLVRVLPDARRQVIAFVSPGHFVGRSESVLHRHDIEAVVPSRLCAFELDAIRDLRARFPSFEHTLLERAGRDLDDAYDVMLLLARLSPPERLASFLLRLRQQMGVREDDPQLVLPMPRVDIADHLGLTVETVSRCFSRLREQRLIALPDPQRLEILDHAALRDLASALR